MDYNTLFSLKLLSVVCKTVTVARTGRRLSSANGVLLHAVAGPGYRSEVGDVQDRSAAYDMSHRDGVAPRPLRGTWRGD